MKNTEDEEPLEAREALLEIIVTLSKTVKKLSDALAGFTASERRY